MRVLFSLTILLLSGCMSLDQLYREVERLPRQWDPRGSSRTDSRVERDARDYVRDMDRAVRLDNRQERQIQDILTYRASRLGGRDYPFPRQRATSWRAEDWWRESDRQIERVLSRRQADDYYDFVYRLEDRRYRDYDDDDDDWDDDDD